jgi:hypothetical protein
MGSEGRDEYNEPHAPVKASSDTMGNSIHFRAKDMGRPVPFKAPDWAVKHENPTYFYEQGRIPKDKRGGFWWLEIGVPYHTIYDNENIRHELTRHTLGVWDWMKNYDPIMKEETKNYALDWIGQVPGKRESRRILGEYFVNEHDILDKTVSPMRWVLAAGLLICILLAVCWPNILKRLRQLMKVSMIPLANIW